MSARYLLLLTHALLSYGLNVNRFTQYRDIISKSKTELAPLFISGELNDIIVISAPIVSSSTTEYYLNKPTGEVVKVNLSEPVWIKPINKTINFDEDRVKHTKENNIEAKLDKYQVFNINKQGISFTEVENYMNKNDFIIGPLTESDHGNWVLSIYTKDIDGDWIEIFQVITIETIERILPNLNVTKLTPGDTFLPSFAYPIKELESCEIGVPISTFDRSFDRNRLAMDSCGYVVQNVTSEDQGIWTITAVGRIVYETQIYLKILD